MIHVPEINRVAPPRIPSGGISRRGISFVEIAIGIILLALALVPTYALMVKNTRGLQITTDEVEAVSICCSTIEALQSMDYENLVQPPGEVTADGVSLESIDEAVREHLWHIPPYDENRFHVWVKVEESLPLGADPALLSSYERRRVAMKRIVVTCSWSTRNLERSGFVRDRTIRLATIVSACLR